MHLGGGGGAFLELVGLVTRLAFYILQSLIVFVSL